MKQNKLETTKRRQRLLIVTALILGLLAGCTGYLGFVYTPVEDDFSDASPTQAEDGQTLPEDPFAADPTQVEDGQTMPQDPFAADPTQAEDGQTLPQDPFAADPTQAEDGQTLPQDPFAADPTQAEDGQTLPEDPFAADPTQAEDGQTMPEDPFAADPTQAEDSQTMPEDPFAADPTTLPTEESTPPLPISPGKTPPGNLPPVITTPPAEKDMLSQIYPQDLENDASKNRSQSPFRLCMQIICCISLAALAVDISVLMVMRKNIQKYEERKLKKADPYRPTKVASIPITRKKVEQPLYPIPGISLGKAHNMGKREYQQDSFGQSPVLADSGILAVLADGMGGLSNGERVSQKIIMEALNFAVTIRQQQIPRALPDMVERVNQAVNQMLGPSGLYTSGSTLVSALIVKDALWWISVGDSRIYLYRDQHLSQLSRDHDLFQEWMSEILDGRRSLEEAVSNPDGRKLTSFIGMGELRYVDRNHSSIPLLPGDRILLMSDGIYGTVSDAEMALILRSCANVQEAASQIARKISAAALPYQDNYTLIILGYDPPQ